MEHLFPFLHPNLKSVTLFVLSTTNSLSARRVTPQNKHALIEIQMDIYTTRVSDFRA